MPDTTRRDFLLQASATSAGVLLTGLSGTASATNMVTTDVATPVAPPPFAHLVQPRLLSFDPAKLNGLSEKLIRSHWENNYGGSVKALNAVKKLLVAALADKEAPPFVYNDLKREHLLRTGSVVLHELYFDNLGGSGKADADIRTQIGKTFGDFNTWETEFRRIATGLAGGSGWVMLGYNLHLHALENYWLADHLHSPAATVPLLVMDMYEHSYHLDFGAAAARYLDAFFQNIRWETVAARLAAASQFSAGRSTA